MNYLRNAKPVGVCSSLLFLPQNGVVDFGTGGSSPQTDRASTIDTHSVNLGTSNTSKQRPSALAVSTKNGFPQKIIRQEDSDNGSLPSTPEQNSDSELDAEYEALEKDTRQLMKRFLGEFTGLMNPQWNEKKELATMKRVVDDVLEKHRYAYNGMINKLSLDDRGDNMRFVSAVANSLFGDGTTNWGRVASLVAFGAVVCQYLKEKGRENCVELVGEEISTYLLTNQRDWLVKNNSWDGFVEFFRVADPESTVRNTLMAFAGFAGIGATLALLIRGCDIM